MLLKIVFTAQVKIYGPMPAHEARHDKEKKETNWGPGDELVRPFQEGC